MKKIISGLLISIMLFAGCANTNINQSVQTESEIKTVKRREITRTDKSNETDFESKIISDKGSILEKSKVLYTEEFEVLDSYDISDEEKLSIILATHYFNMQYRIDIEAMADMSLALAEFLKRNEKGVIVDFLLSDDYELWSVEDAEMTGNTISFNAVFHYVFDIREISLSYMKLTFEWDEEKWTCISARDADPEASRKPNYYLVMSKKAQESEELFGVANLLDLFVFKGENYREFYTEKYVDNNSAITVPTLFNDRDPNEEIKITEDGYFNVTPEQLKQNINNIAGYELIEGTYEVIDDEDGLMYVYMLGKTVRLILFEEIESDNYFYCIAIMQGKVDEDVRKAEEPLFFDAISSATRACNPNKNDDSDKASVIFMQRVIDGRFGENYFDLGEVDVEAAEQDGIYAFYIYVS